jgi:hypothetical protein
MPALALVLLLVCGFAVAACGGGGEDEEAAIREMIVATAKSRDPAGCTRAVTLHYLEQTTKLDGEAAVTACEEDTVDPQSEMPEEVTVSRVEAGAGTATATVSFTGSAYDGQIVRFALVKREGNWKLHELLGFVGLDGDRLATEMGRQLMLDMESPEEVETGACIVGLLEEMSDRALEELVLDAGLEQILALADRCSSRSDSV